MAQYGYFVMVRNDYQMREGGRGGGGATQLIAKLFMSGVCVDFDLIFLLKI